MNKHYIKDECLKGLKHELDLVNFNICEFRSYLLGMHFEDDRLNGNKRDIMQSITKIYAYMAILEATELLPMFTVFFNENIIATIKKIYSDLENQ